MATSTQHIFRDYNIIKNKFKSEMSFVRYELWHIEKAKRVRKELRLKKRNERSLWNFQLKNSSLNTKTGKCVRRKEKLEGVSIHCFIGGMPYSRWFFALPLFVHLFSIIKSSKGELLKIIISLKIIIFINKCFEILKTERIFFPNKRLNVE